MRNSKTTTNNKRPKSQISFLIFILYAFFSSVSRILNIWIKLIYYIVQLDIYHQYSEVSELVHMVTDTYRNTENPGPPREILQGGTRLLRGPGGQTETSLKIEDLRSNTTTGKLSYDQQQGFRSLSEFYIIIFLNKLK